MNDIYKKLQDFLTLAKSNPDPSGAHKELAIKVHQALSKRAASVSSATVSSPGIVNTPGTVSLPFEVAGPTMLNVRGGAVKKGQPMSKDLFKSLHEKLSSALNKKWGQKQSQPAVQDIGNQMYHIHDVSGDKPLRITTKPMKLNDIHNRWGKNIESKGFKLIPHNLDKPQGPAGQ
jgi:hypothetical protein